MKPDSLASIMNWSKNLYVFMLGALIVFSGCFGTGTTDGEGDNDAVGTTVINNYYNNTTEVPERIAVGGVVFGEAESTARHYYSHNISTDAGQMLEIVEAEINSDGTSYMDVITICQMGNISFNTQPTQHEELFGHYYIGGSAFQCYHTIDIIDGDTQPQEISWSFVYSIHPVTVG